LTPQTLKTKCLPKEQLSRLNRAT